MRIGWGRDGFCRVSTTILDDNDEVLIVFAGLQDAHAKVTNRE